MYDINYIFYKYSFFCPKGWDQIYTGFSPSSFSISVHWNSITDYKFSKSCVLLFPCFWSQWCQLDIIWANLAITTAEVFPFSSPCGGVYNIPCTPTEVFLKPCVKCDRWVPQVPRAGVGRSVRGFTAHAWCSRVLSVAPSPLSPQEAWNTPTLDVDIWLIAST